jgi:hypothetical protein
MADSILKNPLKRSPGEESQAFGEAFSKSFLRKRWRKIKCFFEILLVVEEFLFELPFGKGFTPQKASFGRQRYKWKLKVR